MRVKGALGDRVVLSRRLIVVVVYYGLWHDNIMVGDAVVFLRTRWWVSRCRCWGGRPRS
jgi:hypothetical protein